MMASPDLAGFREAQATLRAQFGEDVPFFKPLPKTWPPGTPLDPETEAPYDPMIAATASGWASAVAKCSVVARPLGLSRRGVEFDVNTTAVGVFEEGMIVLICGYEEWHAAGLDDATEVEVHAERYLIAQTEQDQLGPGEPERMLAYCQQK